MTSGATEMTCSSKMHMDDRVNEVTGFKSEITFTFEVIEAV